MKFSGFLILFLLLVFAEAKGETIPAAIGDAVNQFVEDAELTEETPGIAILVTDSRTKAILYQRYIGQASLGQSRPIDLRTPFRLGSVSKPMTAAAILQLAQQGKLRLQDPVRRYLPTLSWDEVTIHHLLTHTAGPPEYTAFQFLKSKAGNTDILSYMEGKRLKFSAGSERKYSNSGYAMLASVIEVVTGQTYADYMKQAMFDPLGMESTSVPGLHWKQVPDRAVGYNRVLRQYMEDDDDFLNGVVGDRGVYASTEDLDRWLTAYFNHRVIHRDMVELALQKNPAAGENFAYGYGWILDRIAGETLAWHNGCWVGFDTFVGRLVEKEVNIVALSNAGLDTRDLSLTQLGFTIAMALRGWEPK